MAHTGIDCCFCKWIWFSRRGIDCIDHSGCYSVRDNLVATAVETPDREIFRGDVIGFVKCIATSADGRDRGEHIGIFARGSPDSETTETKSGEINSAIINPEIPFHMIDDLHYI